MANKHSDFEGDWNDVHKDGFWDGPVGDQEFVLLDNGWDEYRPEDIPSADFCEKLNKHLRENGQVLVLCWNGGDPGMGAYGKIFDLPPNRM